MLYFFQADNFLKTILKIEGDAISAIEIAHHVDALRGNLMLRKTKNYLEPATETEKLRLIHSKEYDADTIQNIFDHFFGECLNNLVYF